MEHAMFSWLKYICVEAKSVRWEFVLQAQTFYLPCKNSIDQSTARDFTVGSANMEVG